MSLKEKRKKTDDQKQHAHLKTKHIQNAHGHKRSSIVHCMAKTVRQITLNFPKIKMTPRIRKKMTTKNKSDPFFLFVCSFVDPPPSPPVNQLKTSARMNVVLKKCSTPHTKLHP